MTITIFGKQNLHELLGQAGRRGATKSSGSANRATFVIQNLSTNDVELSTIEDGGAEFGEGILLVASGGIIEVDIFDIKRFWINAPTSTDLKIMAL